jgi:signal transduction protein with GAF and PtsI domain
MDILIILIIATTLIAFILSIYSTIDIYSSVLAEKQLKQLIEKNIKTKSQLQKAFKEINEKGNEKNWHVIEITLKKEIDELKDDNQKEKLLDILENNTEIGRKRYINTFVASL